jgi:hypothetical protein
MKCNECRYLGDDMTCHRGPPQVYFSSMGLKFAFPPVSPFVDWCGRGESKAATKPVTAVSEGLDKLLGETKERDRGIPPIPKLPPIPAGNPPEKVKPKGKPGRKVKR